MRLVEEIVQAQEEIIIKKTIIDILHKLYWKKNKINYKYITKFQNISIVAANLRGMRLTPSTKKDTLMLREELKL